MITNKKYLWTSWDSYENKTIRQFRVKSPAAPFFRNLLIERGVWYYCIVHWPALPMKLVCDRITQFSPAAYEDPTRLKHPTNFIALNYECQSYDSSRLSNVEDEGAVKNVAKIL
jgi:hypothetical protein